MNSSLELLVDFRLGSLGHFEPVANIVAHGQMRENRVVLINNPKLTLLNGQGIYIFTIKQDGATFQGESACNRFQQHGFSCARFSYDGEHFSWFN